jgi:phosphoribosylamine--glycine ligase
VLSLLESDLFDIMRAVTEERLAEVEVKFSGGASCCVVVASRGYPEKFETGCELMLPDEEGEGVNIYVAGARLENGRLRTSGGRVLGVTAVGRNLTEAVEKAYRAAEKVRFENAFYRRDIGKRALEAMRRK